MLMKALAGLLLLAGCGNIGLRDPLNAVVDADGSLFVRSCWSDDDLLRVKVTRQDVVVLDAQGSAGQLELTDPVNVLEAVSSGHMSAEIQALDDGLVDGDDLEIWTTRNSLGFTVGSVPRQDVGHLKC
jgi:hypothetical protein